jgi:hypothetical protein
VLARGVPPESVAAALSVLGFLPVRFIAALRACPARALSREEPLGDVDGDAFPTLSSPGM